MSSQQSTEQLARVSTAEHADEILGNALHKYKNNPTVLRKPIYKQPLLSLHYFMPCNKLLLCILTSGSRIPWRPQKSTEQTSTARSDLPSEEAPTGGGSGVQNEQLYYLKYLFRLLLKSLTGLHHCELFSEPTLSQILSQCKEMSSRQQVGTRTVQGNTTHNVLCKKRNQSVSHNTSQQSLWRADLPRC